MSIDPSLSSFSDIVVLYGCSGPPGHVALYKLITEAVLILHKDKIFDIVVRFRCRISSLQENRRRDSIVPWY